MVDYDSIINRKYKALESAIDFEDTEFIYNSLQSLIELINEMENSEVSQNTIDDAKFVMSKMESALNDLNNL